jgi:two-component system OmpR family sensor kinase
VHATDVRRLLTSSMVVMHSQAAATDVSLKVTIDANVPDTVMLDGAKVAWAAVNLVGNALRYLRHTGRYATRGAIEVSVTYDTTASSLAIDVRDNGPGIAPGVASRLFNHEDPQGPSGLGLLLVDDIATAHGGSVEIRSSTDPESHGTTIRLTIRTRR